MLALLILAAPVFAQQPPVVTDTARRMRTLTITDSAARIAPDTALVPAPDQARGIESELRIALFELANDRLLSALNRLEWLRSAPLGDSAAPATWREDLIFLLSQAQYHLGMSEAFQASAQQALGGSRTARFAPLLGSQLMLDAYRRSEYDRAQELAGSVGAAGDRALSSLIAGLSHYHARNFQAARASFAAARQAGGAFAPYAQYMDAVAMLQGDTLQAAAALEALRAMAGSATGELADQARLTAAELAHQSGQYDVAAATAAEIPETSGLAPQALLTRAWALYRGRQVDSAGTAFAAFASRYPYMVERDEARVMAGQVMLEAGRIDEANRYFDLVADSITAEARSLEAASNTALGGAARALVAARAAGVLFTRDPQAGKAIALADSSGTFRDALLAVYTGSPPPAPPASAAPEVITVADVETRLQALAPALGGFPRRVVYAAGNPDTAAMFIRSADRLRAADMMVAVARYRVQEQADAQAAKVAAMQRLHFLIGEGNSGLAQVAARLQATQDSLTRMIAVLDASRASVRQFIQEQVDGARQLATENIARLDSTRSSLAGTMSQGDAEVIALERQTAEYYLEMSELVGRGLDTAIAHHPVFAMHDSVGRRLAGSRELMSEARSVMAATDQAASGELSRLQSSESERTRALRAALASTEERRAAVETQLVGLVEAELRSRASQVVARLNRDIEAAEFGSASALFFRAIESGGASTTPRTAAPGTGASAATPNPPPAGRPTPARTGGGAP
jgi:hypothetical protein